jgi:hypothetical protein
MKIESRSTRDQLVRDAIFLVMCMGMAGYFALDGWVRYPAANLRWAAQKLPVRPSGLATNPRARERDLKRIVDGMTVEQVAQSLGPPTLDLPRELSYIGKQITAFVSFDEQGKAVGVRTAATVANLPENQIQANVTKSRVERVKEGMSEDQVGELLGTPVLVREQRTLWYIGPVAYREFRIERGKVRGASETQGQIQAAEHSEGDLLLQKIIAVVVGLAAVYGAFRLWRTLAIHVVVDDTGLSCSGRSIPWQAMTGLRTDQYKDKAWVDLEYQEGGVERTIRLDSYLIRGFDQVITAICDRKGFQSPLTASRPEDTGKPS